MNTARQMDLFSGIGGWVLRRFMIVTDVCSLLIRFLIDLLLVFRNGYWAVRTVFLRQIYFTGLEAIAIVIMIAIILAAVVMTQTIGLIGVNGPLAGKIMVLVVLRELAPLLTAVIVIARSGTAIATELSHMKLNGEMESLEMMGISASRYLVLPRVAGVTVSVVILTVYFVMVAFLGSALLAMFVWHIPFNHFLQGVLSSFELKEIFVLLAKSALFGLFISAVCCCYGFRVGKSLTEVPQAATKAVMTSIFCVFSIDGLLTVLASIARQMQ